MVGFAFSLIQSSSKSSSDRVGVLNRRRLHEVCGRGFERTADAGIERDLREPHGIDDHSGRIRRVPDLELVFEGCRGIPEPVTLESHECELAVVEPGDVVARPNVHVSRVDGRTQVARDRLRLGDLLRLEPPALEHVLEVHVAADVKLVRAVEHEPALLEQSRENTVSDGRTELALDVVADNRDARRPRTLSAHTGSLAMNTGRAFTKATPASSAAWA